MRLEKESENHFQLSSTKKKRVAAHTWNSHPLVILFLLENVDKG